MRFFAIASSRFSFRMAIIWSSRFRRDSSASADFLKDFFRESCRDADGRNMTMTLIGRPKKSLSLSLSLSFVGGGGGGGVDPPPNKKFCGVFFGGVPFFLSLEKREQ